MDSPLIGRPTDDNQPAPPPGEGRVMAVLGPTNTGKTYLAVERMLGHQKGMIGFPLRLLARENYDKIVKLKGANQVALITGEEKIIPPRPRYFVCTVESMPLDLPVDFLAIDEIQMAADSERGHIFTERLLYARGSAETMFLGSETARWLIRKLVPHCEFITRPRFSTLAYAGHRKVTRLPPRSAIVAFSAAEVYRLAELVRRQRGGTAVVLGALSPRARNAQVGMYQAGEVDYLVATDAIGMGLNMDVHHVAFSALSKYDGNRMRDLLPAETGQIAGRAGRHMTDGTFGTTAGLEGMGDEVVLRVENHDFETLRTLMWRSIDLDFRSIKSLLTSLEAKPPYPFLRRARRADDQRTLESLAEMSEVVERATGKTAVQLLWDVCQVPDFSKTLTDSHTRLLGRIYRFRSQGEGRLPTDWVAGHIKRLDRTEGDIDTLMARIAGTRTWTYISHRTGWLDDPVHWQEQALAIEDKLSDALHDRLTQRFVDRRTAVLVRRLADGDELIGGVNAEGEVVVEGEVVGTLRGFRFTADTADRGEDGRALLNAANRVLRQEIDGRVGLVTQAKHKDFRLAEDGRITWDGEPLGVLVKGSDWLKPRLEPLGSALLDSRHRQALRGRMQEWLDREVSRRVGVLAELRSLEGSPALRGIGYRLAEMAGVMPRRALQEQLAVLTKAERKQLSGLGVRIGRDSLYVPQLLRGGAHRWRMTLWCLFGGTTAPELTRDPVVATDKAVDADWYRLFGYTVIGPRAIRLDRWEAFAAAAFKALEAGPLVASAELARAAGVDDDALPYLFRRLHLAPTGQTTEGGDKIYGRKGRGARRSDKAQPHRRRSGKVPGQADRPDRGHPDSPFAGLRAALDLVDAG